ncbi:MAG: hypothetical protein RIB67_07440 [Miltoncostaeaceae bacterium]
MGRVLTPPGIARADRFFERLVSRVAALERRSWPTVPVIDDVADLPSSPREGQRVDLWASGRMFELTWRGVANSGSGAWMVGGGGSLAAAAEGSNFTTSTSYSTMTNGPTISLPFGALWEFEWTARMASNNSANAVRAAVSGPGFSGEGGNTVFGSTLSVPCSGLTGPIAVSGAGTAALQFLTDNGSFTCTALQRRLRARPVEIRP